jgi:truncated hemoglobin YjbI
MWRASSANDLALEAPVRAVCAVHHRIVHRVEAHRDLRISPKEFDEVAAELGRTLDFFKVPKREKTEVLAAFAAHKGEVTAGYVENPKRG